MKNFRIRFDCAKNDLDKALAQLTLLDEENKSKNSQIDEVNRKLTSTIVEKKQLLAEKKKIFDQKFKTNFSKKAGKFSVLL